MAPSFAMGSIAASLIGSKIGCANVTAAKYYYRSAMIVQIIVAAVECTLLSAWMLILVDRVTDSKEL